MKTLLFGTLLIGLAAGCAEIRDEIDDSLISIKGRTAASAAWKDSTQIFGGIGDEHHFADGFRAGYFNATKYGTEHRPRIPLRYTGHAYRSRRGQQRVQAWIDGFAHGTMIAMDDLIPEIGPGHETVGYESTASDQAADESGEDQVSDKAAGSAVEPASSQPKLTPPTD